MEIPLFIRSTMQNITAACLIAIWWISLVAGSNDNVTDTAHSITVNVTSSSYANEVNSTPLSFLVIGDWGK